MATIALYPGSFDPITYGHLDILERACSLFDKVIVTVGVNRKKSTLFNGEERVALIKDCISDKAWHNKVEVRSFTGLLVNFAREVEANTLVRGVRQVSDFEYEFQMALMNRRLAPEIETLFLMPREDLIFVSASIVKEAAYWGGDIDSFVPEQVASALLNKFKEQQGNKG